MITDEDHRLRALADDGRWPELLAAYRQGRAAAVERAGEAMAAGLAAPLGHLIAYSAPPEVAARLFDPDGGPGAAAGVGDHDAGPLWEVLATRHSWLRLAPLLGPAPVRRLVAHTRVLLGEDLAYGGFAGGPEPGADGVPLRLEPWEAAGWEEGARVREYLPCGGARSALLTLPADREGLVEVELPEPVERLGGQRAHRATVAAAALAALAPWAETVCVRGSAPLAAARLARRRRVTGGYLPFALVYPALVQAASGGRERGSAHGRLAVWRALAAMAGARRPGGPEAAALVARMRCFTWLEPAEGLRHLHVALEDPASGVAWGISGSEEL
ncbi:hypothetical protein [Streptomyces sp. NRRL WC-3742]|uniref:hypothetical protein n=1 Tax=Streptomyces sp. NRRL WC-3742 TaxID=1463934 RepID=UPI0004CB78FA|nr:hypothetical protein [Streptomyces sp. NRRL WC-3742]